jgi:nitrate reductase gamma subunit
VISTAAYLSAYIFAVLFILGIVVKVIRYRRNPLHLRWELYPVAHEKEKSEYGGSYLEEVDWLHKPRTKSLMGELRVMVPEILFLKAVHEANRTLWLVTFPFHFGLYCTAASIFLVFGAAAAEAAGFPGMSGKALLPFLNILGICGVILSIVGAVGLIYRRLTDDGLREYTSFDHYFNLGWFLVVMVLTLLSWFTNGRSFAQFQTYAAGVIRFNITQELALSTALPAILGAALVAYIPWTHMAHFFMKYYLYHDIRWGDEAMTGAPRTERKLQSVLNYRPTWSAAHINGGGRKTWAELATQNPTRELPKE